MIDRRGFQAGSVSSAQISSASLTEATGALPRDLVVMAKQIDGTVRNLTAEQIATVSKDPTYTVIKHLSSRIDDLAMTTANPAPPNVSSPAGPCNATCWNAVPAP